MVWHRQGQGLLSHTSDFRSQKQTLGRGWGGGGSHSQGYFGFDPALFPGGVVQGWKVKEDPGESLARWGWAGWRRKRRHQGGRDRYQFQGFSPYAPG